ncbi:MULTISPECIES: type IV pilin protein [unclassified Bilifractor]|uniref:type IV pilin protein n=1 Tax=unclassified Bilifractor TaxID=2815795 RepID=UPI003F8D9D72
MLKKLKNSKKGFTLAELLIVVAIIGVLVAISIPIFTAQLEKAREATDAANIRSAYAELAADALTGEAVTASTEGNITINDAKADSDTLTATVQLTQTTAGWQSSNLKGSKIGSMDAGDPTANGTATITVTRSTGVAALTYN